MSDGVREHLRRVLGWEDAHVGFEATVRDLPLELRGVRPPGLPHSAWELVEHIRITQRDILDFTVAGDYRELEWPGDYWPATPAPPTPDAWERSISAYLADRARLEALTMDGSAELLAVVPHGERQTLLRELLLVADHTAYHLGQLVLVRRALGAWPVG